MTPVRVIHCKGAGVFVPKTIREELVAKTAEGPVETWLTRMSAYAKEAGIPLEKIPWTGSPVHVAFEICEEAKRTDKLDALAKALGCVVVEFKRDGRGPTG